MKTALITGKTNIPSLSPIFNKLQQELKKLNIDSFILHSGEHTEKKFDIVFSIGGDGNYISAARHFAAFHKPIIGISAGTLGFLPSIDPEDMEEQLEIICNNTVWMKRMLLTGETNTGQRLSALNEFLFSNDRKGILSEFTICIDKEPVMKVRSDGILIGTPTGSTAYNLSAGGPITMPDMELIIITPVCSHILGERPLVVGTNHDIQIINHSLSPAKVWADGQEDISLNPQEIFTVIESTYIKSQPITSKIFFDTLSKKLGWHLGNFKN